MDAQAIVGRIIAPAEALNDEARHSDISLAEAKQLVGEIRHVEDWLYSVRKYLSE